MSINDRSWIQRKMHFTVTQYHGNFHTGMLVPYVVTDGPIQRGDPDIDDCRRVSQIA